MFSRTYLFFLTIYLPLLAASQKANLGIPPITNYSKDTYQAGTQNWNIIQDNRGVLYLGNNNGLLQFDGTTWQCTPLPYKTILHSLAIDANGKIYVGGQNEIGFFFPNDRGILTFNSLLHLLPKEHQQFEDIWDISISPQGVFFRTSYKIFRLKGEKFTIFTFPEGLAKLGISNHKILANSLLKGLLTFDGTGFVPLCKEENLKNKIVTGILSFPDKRFLLTSLKAGIFLYEKGKIRPWQTPIDPFLKQNRIYSAARINEQHFALGTSQSGLVILDNSGRPLWHLTKKSGLQNNNVLALFADHQHNLWVGLDNGIDYVKTNSFFSDIYPDGGLGGTAYTVMVHNGNIYFGTSNGLFYRDWKMYYDPFDEKPFKAVQNTQGQVWGLNEIGNDLFLGHHEGIFLVQNGVAKMISDYSGSWTFSPAGEKANKIIAGTYRGLALLEKNNSRWQFKKKLRGLEESSRIMTKDKSGNLWMSHPYRGVYKIELDEGSTNIRKVSFYGSKNGLPSNYMNYVALINDQIVVAAEHGIFNYDSLKNRFAANRVLGNIFGKDIQVKRLIQDSNGNIWFAAGEDVGILEVIDKGFEKELKKIIFPELHGKLVGGFEFIYPFDKHNVFIGAEKGFIHLDPTKLSLQDSSFQVILNEVVVIKDRDSLVFGGNFLHKNRVVLHQPSDQIPIFPASMNAFRFSYSAPDFANHGLLNYRIKLDGLDKEWSSWRNNTEKEYTNLGHGEYTFIVQAKNSRGVESKVISYRFEILPKWYASKLALGIYTFIFLFIIFVSIAATRWKYKKEAAILKSKHQKMVTQTEKEMVHLKNEKLEGEILHKNRELATVTMHLVQKSEMLHKIQLELNKIAKNVTHQKLHKEIKQLARSIQSDARLDEDWEQFSIHFDQVYSNFLNRLRQQYPHLTPKDQKLCAYLRMNLSTKEIAPLMSISVRGVEVSRYRIRKKLNLSQEVNLVEFMMGI